MQRTVSYHVLVTRTSKGYLAYAPAFPDLAGKGSSGRVAYARFKLLLKDRVASLLAGVERLPRDPVFQTRTLRLDLMYLNQRESLT